MGTDAPSQASGNGPPALPARVVCLFGGPLERYWQLGLALREANIELRPADQESPLGRCLSEVSAARGVVLLDLTTGQSAGLALAERCRAVAPSVPLVAVVASRSLDTKKRLRGAGILYEVIEPMDAAAARATLELALAEAARRDVGEPGKILVIDDDPDYLAAVTALLESRGYEVSQASSGRTGLERALADLPDLIVLDLMLEQEWTGYELTQAIKVQERYARVRATPILVVSAVQEPPEDRFARSPDPELVRPDSYLTKPIDVPVFLEAVESLLALRRAAPRPAERLAGP